MAGLEANGFVISMYLVPGLVDDVVGICQPTPSFPT